MSKSLTDKIYEWLLVHDGTYHDIDQALGLVYPARSNPRVSELYKKGMVENVGTKRKDVITGKSSSVWRGIPRSAMKVVPKNPIISEKKGIETAIDEQRQMLKNPRIEAVLTALWATTEQDREYLWRQVYPQFKPISLLRARMR